MGYYHCYSSVVLYFGYTAEQRVGGILNELSTRVPIISIKVLDSAGLLYPLAHWREGRLSWGEILPQNRSTSKYRALFHKPTDRVDGFSSPSRILHSVKLT